MAQPKAPENETPQQKWKRLSKERMAKRVRPAFKVMQNLATDNYEASEDDWKPVILDLRDLLRSLEDAAGRHADKSAIIAEKRRLEREKEREREASQASDRDRWAA
jgi:hypothetical protein